MSRFFSHDAWAVDVTTRDGLVHLTVQSADMLAPHTYKLNRAEALREAEFRRSRGREFLNRHVPASETDLRNAEECRLLAGLLEEAAAGT